MSSYKPLFQNSQKRYAKEAPDDGCPAGTKGTVFSIVFSNYFSVLNWTEFPYRSVDLPLWKDVQLCQVVLGKNMATEGTTRAVLPQVSLNFCFYKWKARAA